MMPSFTSSSFGSPAFDQHKDWWTQAEGLNALLLIHRKYGRETSRYWEAFLKEWSFIEKHLIDGEKHKLIVVSTQENAEQTKEISDHVEPMFKELGVRLVRPRDAARFAEEVEASTH